VSTHGTTSKNVFDPKRVAQGTVRRLQGRIKCHHCSVGYTHGYSRCSPAANRRAFANAVRLDSSQRRMRRPLSLGERARVRGKVMQPTKTAGRILQAQIDRLPKGQRPQCSFELPFDSWPTATDQGKPGFLATSSPPMALCLRDFGRPKKSSKKDCHVRPENAYSTTGLLGSTRLGAPAALAGDSHAMPFSSQRPTPILTESRTGWLVVSRS